MLTRPDHAQMPRTSRALWLFAGFACFVMLGLLSTHFRRSGQGTDFPEFYGAARLVGAGLGPRLYDPVLQWQFQARLTGRVGTLFNHPPFETLLYLPFCLFPYRVAYLLWSAFTLLLLGVSARLLHRRLAAPAPVPALFMLFLAFTPVSLNLLEGQDSVLVLMAFTLALSRMEGHPADAGAWLALGLIKFQFVLPAVLILLARKKRRAFAMGFVVAALALVLISIAISGTSVLISYTQFLLRLNRVGLSGIHPEAMPNLRGLCALPLAGSARAEYAALLAMSVLVFVAAWDAWRRAADPGKMNLAVSSTILAAVLLSYHANPHDLTLLLIPLAITFTYLRTAAARTSRLWLPLLLTSVVLGLPPLHVFALRAHLYSPVALAALTLFAVTYLEIRRPQNAVPAP